MPTTINAKIVPSFAVILIAQVIWGMGYTFTSGATQAWITDEVGETRAANLFLRGAQLEQIAAVIATIAAVAIGLSGSSSLTRRATISASDYLASPNNWLYSFIS